MSSCRIDSSSIPRDYLHILFNSNRNGVSSKQKAESQRVSKAKSKLEVTSQKEPYDKIALASVELFPDGYPKG